MSRVRIDACRYSHVSFVDCPGHDILMATMLNGAAVMDAALLLIGSYPTSCSPDRAQSVGRCGDRAVRAVSVPTLADQKSRHVTALVQNRSYQPRLPLFGDG